MKRLSILFFLLFLFVGCGTVAKEGENPDGVDSSLDVEMVDCNQTTPLEYLNCIRTNSGMIELKEDSLLTYAAEQHVIYMKNTLDIGHYEDSSYTDYYYGYDPLERAQNAGYNGPVGENLSSGSNDFYHSIDLLFAAIYHRFGFLSFDYDAIGFYGSDGYYVYDMGISQIDTLCNDDNAFSGAGSYYTNICIDTDKKIDLDKYESARYENANSNPSYVVYPYNDSNDSLPAFYEETPDPVPSCEVTSNPVSIHFNEQKFDADSFEFLDFRLFNEDGSEIDDTIILTESTDVNGMLSPLEFAVFAEDRFDWNTTYTARFSYVYNSDHENIEWEFTTRTPADEFYTVTYDEEVVRVSSDTTVAFYVKPDDCTSSLQSFTLTYPNDVTINSKGWIDGHTLYLNISGNYGSEVEVVFGNNKGFTAKLKD